MAAAHLRLAQVGLTYESGFQALDGVSAEFAPGSFTALVGPSGCGKSSLLRLMAGLQTPSSGALDTVAQSDIGFVFQEPTLLAWKTVAQNVALPLQIAAGKSRPDNAEIARRVRDALQLVGLGDWADALPRQLSGGMKMRVSLARALAKCPPVLLMDEPFAALDELTRFRLDDDLRAIWQQTACTIVFVTHSVTEAAYLAERALVMAPGRIKGELLIDQSGRTSDGSADFRAAPAFHAACAAISEALGHQGVA